MACIVDVDVVIFLNVSITYPYSQTVYHGSCFTVLTLCYHYVTVFFMLVVVIRCSIIIIILC